MVKRAAGRHLRSPIQLRESSACLLSFRIIAYLQRLSVARPLGEHIGQPAPLAPRRIHSARGSVGVRLYSPHATGDAGTPQSNRAIRASTLIVLFSSPLGGNLTPARRAPPV